LTALAGDQALVVWQSSHVVLVEICVDDLPVALVPLWQDEHVPLILAWLKLAGDQAEVVWQVLHSAVVAICVVGFPAALLPL
jgi:hypothetical protein